MGFLSAAKVLATLKVAFIVFKFDILTVIVMFDSIILTQIIAFCP